MVYLFYKVLRRREKMDELKFTDNFEWVESTLDNLKRVRYQYVDFLTSKYIYIDVPEPVATSAVSFFSEGEVICILDENEDYINDTFSSSKYKDYFVFEIFMDSKEGSKYLIHKDVASTFIETTSFRNMDIELSNFDTDDD
jgi:hypothetical protein